jgi:hypothetical protein
MFMMNSFVESQGFKVGQTLTSNISKLKALKLM